MKNSPYSIRNGQRNQSLSRFTLPLLTILLFSAFTLQPVFSQFYASPNGTGDGTGGNPASFQHALNLAKAAGLPGVPVSISLFPGTYTSPVGGYKLSLAKNESLTLFISGTGESTPEGDYVPSVTFDGDSVNHILRFMANSNNASLVLYLSSVKFQNGLAKDDGNAKTWDHGGAVSAYSGNVDSSGFIQLNISQCIFEGNKTSGNISGGAIASNCQVNISQSIFRSNGASNGGAIYAGDSPGGNYATPYSIMYCQFYNNTNYGNQGSTIYHSLTLNVKNSEFYGRTDGVSSSGNGSCMGQSALHQQYSPLPVQKYHHKILGKCFSDLRGKCKHPGMPLS